MPVFVGERLPTTSVNLSNYRTGRLLEDHLRSCVGGLLSVPAPLEKTGDRGKLLSCLRHQSADGSLIISARAAGQLVNEAASGELGNQGPVATTHGLPVVPLCSKTICVLAPLFGRTGPVLVRDHHARRPGAARTSREAISND